MDRRRLFAGFGLMLLISFSAMPEADAAAAADPAGYITGLGNQVLALVKDKQRPEQERERQFRQLVDRAFDVPTMARFILGRHWTTASEAERRQFIEAFDAYMVHVYWSRFSQYAAEGFTVLAQRELGAKSVRVTTEIVRPAGQVPANVDWIVTSQGDTYKISDVSVEGISQALTYREEFASIMARNGGSISALADELRRKAGG